ncbi:MAG: hypothetical protein ACQESR_21690 [Planctomycetota bacterium]
MILLALTDMSHAPYAILIVLVIGTIVLRLVSPSKSRMGIPLLITAFVAGPFVAVCFLLLDMFVVSPNSYVRSEDYVKFSVSVLFIGVMAGAIGAVGLWVGDLIRFNSPTEAHNRKQNAPDQSEDEN